ncbi:MAG: alpha/beta hydrolase [Myxococcota bacterium]
MIHWLCSMAFAADPDPAFERLSRKGERLTRKTEVAEQRWTACDGTPGDPDLDKVRAKAERGLIDARSRQVCVLRVLEAWEEPERDVRVLFATNRRSVDGLFVARDADRLGYGIATVHIPARHPVGALERELVVTAIEPLTEEGFLIAVAGELRAAGPSAELLTYVHGYNNSFDYAARRTAQIVHDLDGPIVPVLFAWPSHGGEWFSSAKYTYDENAAARSSSLFADLLDQLLSGTGGAPVNVLAHSMGSRVVVDALVDLDRRDALRHPLDDLVFAAPDVDAAVYGRRYLDLSLEASRRVTVYCASDDRALKVSRGVHGGYDRLGSCRPDTITALERPQLDIVDASKLYVDLLDHDKVADSPRLLSDLSELLSGVPAGDPARALVDRVTHYELPP